MWCSSQYTSLEAKDKVLILVNSPTIFIDLYTDSWLQINFSFSQPKLIYSLQHECSPYKGIGCPHSGSKEPELNSLQSLTGNIERNNSFGTETLKLQKHIILKHIFIQLFTVSVSMANRDWLLYPYVYSNMYL